MTDDLRERVADAITYHPGNRGGHPDRRHLVSLELARTVLKTLRPELEELAEYRSAITWETACLNCSSLLTRSYADYCRADALADAVLAVANQLSQSGVHDAAEQLGAAIDQYQETATGAPGFPLPISPDGSHHYVSTYCVHGDHAACRLRCKTCNADCLCDCGHPTPEPS